MRTLIAIPALVALVGTPAMADERPYVFTQAHNSTAASPVAQTVLFGRAVQIQLPAGPAVWSYVPSGSRNVIVQGSANVDSPGRIAGTDIVQVLDFDIASPADTTVILQAAPVTPAIEAIVPGGRYTLTLSVVQAN